jgi:hypothetical protein
MTRPAACVQCGIKLPERRPVGWDTCGHCCENVRAVDALVGAAALVVGLDADILEAIIRPGCEFRWPGWLTRRHDLTPAELARLVDASRPLADELRAIDRRRLAATAPKRRRA